MLLEVPESRRRDVADSLVYEAELWRHYPVDGWMGAMKELKKMLQDDLAEPATVRAEIVKHKYWVAAAVANVFPSSNASQLLAASAVASRSVSATLAAAAAAVWPAGTSSSSSSPTVCAPASSSTDYSSPTHENVPYFG